jgi:hypothetical protein
VLTGLARILRLDLADGEQCMDERRDEEADGGRGGPS